MKKNKKNVADKKTPPKRNPPPIPDAQVYESIDPEATYDDFQETLSDDDAIYDAPSEDESVPPPPARPQRLKKDQIPTPTEDEDVYEAAEDDETDDSNQDTASGESYKPPLPTRGKKHKEEKKTKPKLAGHGLSLDAIQGARMNLKPTTKPVQKQKSEEEHEPLSPKILKPVKNSKVKDLKAESPTSKPQEPHRPLPEPPSPQSDVNTNGTSAGSDTSDSQTDNRLKTPPLPLRTKTEEDEDEDIYVGAVSDRLTLFEWFHGDISREEGNRRVQAVGKDGTFLIRTSAKSDVQPYTMVLLFQGRVNNLKIRIRNDKRFALGEEKTTEVHFEDVQSLVDFHKKNTVNLTGSNKGETTLKESPSLKT